jgi:hypothetical protein
MIGQRLSYYNAPPFRGANTTLGDSQEPHHKRGRARPTRRKNLKRNKGVRVALRGAS